MVRIRIITAAITVITTIAVTPKDNGYYREGPYTQENGYYNSGDDYRSDGPAIAVHF